MKGLITDRTQQNMQYHKELSNKGWANMTLEERTEWLGDPSLAIGANLIPYGPYYSSAVTLKYRSDEILATSTAAGTYLYATSIIGDADDYTNRVLTLSVDDIAATGGGSPMLAVYWHDANGFEYAGATLVSAGSVTFDTSAMPNANAREYLALYIYVTTHTSVTEGVSAHFTGVMLENGNTRHEYVPYTEILATRATKGAYNYSDLNRVERAVAEISDLGNLGLKTKTDWSAWDIPTASEMNRYLGNIATIRSKYVDMSSVPLVPTSMNQLTYSGANNIETILNAAYEMIKAT